MLDLKNDWMRQWVYHWEVSFIVLVSRIVCWLISFIYLGFK